MVIFLDIGDFFRDIFQHPGELLNPEAVIKYGGTALLFLAVFAQTGLFFCFFLPGDALLFTTGVFIATDDLDQPIAFICILLTCAAFLGNLCGYWFGRSTGPLLYKKKDSLFFRKDHLGVADQFFKKYGGVALTAGLFLPIIRTFAPIIAGVIKYHFARFAFFSSMGVVLWINLLVIAGYLLGRVPFVEHNLEFIILGLIIVITTPVVVKMIHEVNKLRTK